MATPVPKARTTDPNVSEIAALIGDPARAAMLFALLDGQELPASELAFRGGVSAQAASAHLGKLVAADLILARSSGRQRLFKVVSADVAYAMEALATIARPARLVALTQNTAMQRLREARSCYDHLAGRIGVTLTDSLIRKQAITLRDDAFSLGRKGESLFSKLGIDVCRERENRRSFARACLDWTERRPHLAGSLGASLLTFLIADGWLTRNKHDRALHITPRGYTEFKRRFEIEST
ncbi:MAG: ArsR/SmtB family transcription factor [Candidatus Baltobacteraceae bacterium]